MGLFVTAQGAGLSGAILPELEREIGLNPNEGALFGKL